MGNVLLVLVALLLLPGIASAHEDRILTIGPDGSIPEIPAALGSVSLKISGLGTAAPTVKFRSGAHLIDLPACATRFIHTVSPNDVFVTGSWYHDESTLPYYVNVQFFEPGRVASREINSSLNILFNLRTAEVIEVKRFVVNATGNSGQYFPLALPGCTLLPHAA